MSLWEMMSLWENIYLRNYCNQSFFTIIMSDSTSILDLPTDPVGGGSVSGNIVLTAQESNSQPNQQSQGVSLDQTTINQIVNSLQQATLAGATQLPSRDIPMTTNGISVDPQVMPNYVPPSPPHMQDYIKNHEQTSDMIKNYNKGKQMNSSLDDMYNEIQTPLLLSVLYFLFQLPFFKRFLYTYIPLLFSNDGNYNINGLLLTSILFGMLFHLLMKTTSYFGTF
jgi:hypothetical protein